MSMFGGVCIEVDVLSRGDSRGVSEVGEKGVGSVALRQVIDKTLPLPSPDTLMLPAQRTTKSTPELGIEEEVIHMNGAEGVQPEDTNPHTRLGA